MNKIYIVGMGPGFESMMTKQAIDALEANDTFYTSFDTIVKNALDIFLRIIDKR